MGIRKSRVRFKKITGFFVCLFFKESRFSGAEEQEDQKMNGQVMRKWRLFSPEG